MCWGESVACGNSLRAQLLIEAIACNGQKYGVHVLLITGTVDDHGPRLKATDFVLVLQQSVKTGKYQQPGG